MATREKTRFCLIQIRHSLHYTYVDLACLDGYCAYSLVGKPGQKYAPISKHMSLILRYASLKTCAYGIAFLCDIQVFVHERARHETGHISKHYRK